MALRGDGTHRVALDQVIATMRATGRDMHTKYKETVHRRSCRQRLGQLRRVLTPSFGQRDQPASGWVEPG